MGTSMGLKLAEWIPNCIKCSGCNVPPRSLKIDVALAGNSTAISTPNVAAQMDDSTYGDGERPDIHGRSVNDAGN